MILVHCMLTGLVKHTQTHTDTELLVRGWFTGTVGTQYYNVYSTLRE